MDPQSVLNRKRIAEEFRKRRIFNPRLRQIGIDTEALEYQIHEKKLSKDREAERDKQFADQAKRQSDLEELREQRQKEVSDQKDKELNEYRKQEQRPEYSQDYAINDPNWKKKELPPRTSDAELCPVSGLQKFDGEDLESEKRSKKQADQFRDMLQQQIEERRTQKFKEDKAKHDWDTVMLELNSFAQQLEGKAKQHVKEATTALSAENRDIARGKRESLKSAKMAEEIEKQKDVEFNMSGDLLTENPEVGKSIFGPNRVVPDRWKGMNKKQIKEIAEKQAKQIEENKRKKDKEEYEDRQWREHVVEQEKAAKQLEEDKQKQEKDKARKLCLENEQLAQEQRRQKEFLNHVVNTNYVSDDFFAQFNTTSR